MSRDLFDVTEELVLDDYVARSSLASTFASPVKQEHGSIEPELNPSPFQRRMAITEYEKLCATKLASSSWDVLLLDLIDERLPVVKLGSSYVTRSPEMEKCFEQPLPGAIPDTERQLLWEAGVRALQRAVGGRPIVLNRVRWTGVDEQGEVFADLSEVARNNARLELLEAELLRWPNVSATSLDIAWESSEEHRWGRAPFHYSRHTQQAQVRSVLGIVRTIDGGASRSIGKARGQLARSSAKNLFVGHTRFSLYMPGSRAWKLSSGRSEPDYLRQLFDPDRLEARLGYVTDLLIPQIQRAATGYSVVHVISYSAKLPDVYQRRLEEAFENNGTVLLHRVADGAPPPEVSDAIEFALQSGERPSDDGRVVGYRIDDDDAVGDRYFDSLSLMSARGAIGDRLTLPFGYRASLGDEKLRLADVRISEISAGLAGIYSVKDGRVVAGPEESSHNRSTDFNTVISSPDSGAYLCIEHPEQDSKLGTALLESEDRERGFPWRAFFEVSALSDWRMLLKSIQRFLPGRDALKGEISPRSEVNVILALLVSRLGGERSLLVAVDVVDAAGGRVKPSPDTLVTVGGNLSYSDIDGIGFYRYVSAPERYGVETTSTEIKVNGEYSVERVRYVDLRNSESSIQPLCMWVG